MIEDINFSDTYGKALKPAQVGKIFHLDPRTVRKYARDLGGVEVFPGTWRFFDKLVKERIDHAIFDHETRQTPIPGNSGGEGDSRRQTVPGQLERTPSEKRSCGNRPKKKNSWR